MDFVTESENESKGESDEKAIWKKNTRFFYSVLISHRLLWPSLSVEWLKFSGEERSLGYCTHRIAYGTHTDLEEPEKLLVDMIKVPYDDICEKNIEKIVEKNNIITNIVTMHHQGESNRIRVNPSNDYMIASKSSNGNVYVYNYGKVSKGSGDGLRMLLSGHSQEGFGLAWNNCHMLASASNDKKVCVWDCATDKSEPVYQSEALFSHNFHTDVAEDVDWSDEHVLASVGDDQHIVIADIRNKAFCSRFHAHNGFVNSVEFNKMYSDLIITSSQDKTIAVWDKRNLAQSLKRFTTDHQVFSAKWAPFSASIFASTGEDNKVSIWSLSENNLIFNHDGHFCRVNEFSWSPTEKFLMASVDEENYLHIWQMHPGFLN